MGFLGRILGIERLKEELEAERKEIALLRETLQRKYYNLVKFSRLSTNTDIAELKLAVKELEKKIAEIKEDMPKKEIVLEGDSHYSEEATEEA